MITRETKVGLVVASSFVCLVGIVLVSKVLRGDAPATGSEASASASADSATTGPVAVASPVSDKGAKPGGAKLVKEEKHSGVKSPVMLVKTTPQEAQVGVEPGTLVAPTDVVPPPVAPMETQTESGPAIVAAGPTIVEAAPKAADILPAAVEKKEPKVGVSKGDQGLVVEAVKDNEAKPSAPNDDETKAALIAEKKKSEVQEEDTGGNQAGEEETHSPSPIVEVAGAVVAPVVTSMAPHAENKGAPVISSEEGAKLVKTIPVPAQALDDPTQKGTLPAIPPAKPAPDRLPILGAQPTVDSRPIALSPAAAGNGIAAKVESFDYWNHAARQGDTFASISATYYKSEKYGAALREFNQKHPLAARTPQHDPPESGQTVIVPDLAYLEQHYSAMVPAYVPLKIGRPEALIGSSVKETTRPAPAKGAMADAAVVPVAGEKPTVGGATYVVRGTTERLWFIAKETLGDPTRWSEIYRLNPQVAPEGYLPQGTELRLPATASLPK